MALTTGKLTQVDNLKAWEEESDTATPFMKVSTNLDNEMGMVDKYTLMALFILGDGGTE